MLNVYLLFSNKPLFSISLSLAPQGNFSKTLAASCSIRIHCYHVGEAKLHRWRQFFCNRLVRNNFVSKYGLFLSPKSLSLSPSLSISLFLPLSIPPSLVFLFFFILTLSRFLRNRDELLLSTAYLLTVIYNTIFYMQCTKSTNDSHWCEYSSTIKWDAQCHGYYLYCWRYFLILSIHKRRREWEREGEREQQYFEFDIKVLLLILCIV